MEREKGEASNLEVSFSALRKDVANVLDLVEGLKNEEDQKAVDADLIEKLKLELTFICTYVQLSYSDLERFEDIMTGKRKEVENLLRPILDDVDNNVRCKYNMDHVLPSLVDNMEDCISLHHPMMDEQLDFLLLNLHQLSKYRAQFQLMAESVGHFLWEDHIDEDSRLFKLAHLLLKIVSIELDVMNICYTNLKASTSAEFGRFIKKLLETSPDILRECLIHQGGINSCPWLGRENNEGREYQLCHSRLVGKY